MSSLKKLSVVATSAYKQASNSRVVKQAVERINKSRKQVAGVSSAIVSAPVAKVESFHSPFTTALDLRDLK